MQSDSRLRPNDLRNVLNTANASFWLQTLGLVRPPGGSHNDPRMAADPPTPPRFDSLYQEVYLGLWRTYDRLRALEDELFSRYELTAQQYNVLRLLKAARPDGMPTLTL